MLSTVVVHLQYPGVVAKRRSEQWNGEKGPYNNYTTGAFSNNSGKSGPGLSGSAIVVIVIEEGTGVERWGQGRTKSTI